MPTMIQHPHEVVTEPLTVWIVEDDEQYGKDLSELLNLSKVFVGEQVFRSCEPALERLEQDVPPDLLLMDIGLPGIDGIAGTQRVKQVAPDVRVVMLTVFEDSDNIVKAIGAGASGYLLKGSSMAAIVESLKSIHSGVAPINAHIAHTLSEIFAKSSSTAKEFGLTVRENEVLRFLVAGFSKQQIADRLFVSYHTIDKHVRGIYGKYQVHTRYDLFRKFQKQR